jgi:hypothetical protein
MGILKRLIPGTGIPLPPKPKTQTQTTQAYQPVTQSGGGGGAAGAGGGGGAAPATGYRPAATGYTPAVNPWEPAMRANYEAASARPYQGEWRQGVVQAMALGNRNYEGDLRNFAQEDVNRQITAADNQLGALGMRELALKGDVQADRGKMRSDASTRAVIDSQGIKANALETMRGMLGSAQGAELDRVGQMIQAAGTGANNYMDFTGMAAALQEKLGLANKQNDLAAQFAENNARKAAEQHMESQARLARRTQPVYYDISTTGKYRR